MDVKDKKLHDLGFVKVFSNFWRASIFIWILVIKITVKRKQKENVKIWS